jgi:hypothetical protein
MTLRCKPGDLAYIVKAVPHHSDCIGRVVHVLKWLPEWSEWSVEFVGPIPGSFCSGEVMGPDSFMRPITPPGLPEEIMGDIEVTA